MTWKMNVISIRSIGSIALGTVLICTLLVVGCKKEKTSVAPIQTIEVTAVKVEPRDVPITFEWIAQTESSRQVDIRARVEGILEKRVYKEGAIVQEGQVMFEMERKPFEARLDAAKANLGQEDARLANAQQTLERVQGLSERNVVSRQNLDDATNSERAAAAAVEAAKAKVAEAELNLGYTTIRAPITGLSSFATKHDGSYIGAGADSMLTYVAALDPMRINFSISENQVLRIREEVKAGRLVVPPDNSFDVEVLLADGRVHPQKGEVTFSDLAFSRETGTFLVRAEVPNPEGDLRPGQFVRARLLGSVRPKAILVPKRAVLQGAQGSFVWVVGPDGKAELRPLELGDWHGDEWFVNEGLRGGEMVVVDGGIKIQPGATLKVVEPAVQLGTK
ncbi:MAG: rane fusion protein multidrug efflux system [Verrucomicrobiota bacterium]|jgi:membrane fusion protein, multidrug efflux system